MRGFYTGTVVGGHGVYGSSTQGYGVYGTSNNYDGVHGEVDLAGASGVAGVNDATTGNSIGVFGGTSGGYGVYGSGKTAIYGTSTDTSGAGIGVKGVAADGGNGVEGSCSGAYCYAGYFSGNVYTTGTYSSSDSRLKKNVAPMASSLDDLLKLRGVTYEWINPEEHANQTGTQRGFIAQDVEKVFPGWVSQDPKGFKTVSVQQIEALEVESIRTLKMQNDYLAEQVKELQSGRRPVISGIDLNGIGFGIGGLAIAGAVVFATRRKREGSVRTIA